MEPGLVYLLINVPQLSSYTFLSMDYLTFFTPGPSIYV